VTGSALCAALCAALGRLVRAPMLMAASVFFTASAPLLAQRLLAGVPSALVFSPAAQWFGGGLVAPLQPHRSGLFALPAPQRHRFGHRVICLGGTAAAGLGRRRGPRLGAATLLPAVTAAWPRVAVSGLTSGGMSLSVAVSSTALVRHKLPPGQWMAGIGVFTVAFAAGQIVGPTVVGVTADGAGSLARGLVFSAAALWLVVALDWWQRAL